MKRVDFIRCFAVGAFLLSLLTVTAQSKLDKQVLLTIGDQPVTVKEFSDVYSKNNLKGDVVEKKSVDEYLDLFVNFRMKVMEAYEMKLDTSAKFKKELEGYRKQLAKPYFVNDKVADELVEEAYERKLKDIRASHILIRCDKHALPDDTLRAYNKAMEIRKKALKGEDFAALAEQYSDDPSAKDMPATENTPARKGNHGDLGYFTVFDMVYPFETGAYNTKEGEVSMPVRTDFGYHLIKVNSVTDALGTVQAAHIFLKLDPNAKEEEVQATKTKAENIYKELKDTDGKSWDEAVQKYSDDKGTVRQGGILSPFPVNRIVPEFIAVIKQLKPGEISEPLRTNYGFHIIKLINNVKPDTFEKEKKALSERVEKDMRSKKSEEVVIEQIKKDYGYKMNDAHLTDFIATIDSSLLNGSFVPSPDADLNSTLFNIGDETFTVNDFVKFINTKQRKQSYVSVQTYAYQLFDAFRNGMILAHADQHLEEKYPDFKALVKEYNDGILLFDLMEKQVWNKAVEDTVGLQDFHARHEMDYMWKDRVEACIITVNKPESLPRVKKYLEQGVPLDSLRTVLSRDSVHQVTVRKSFYQRGDNNYVDNTEWKVGAQKEFSSTVDASTVIVNITQVRQPEPKTFRECKGVVTSDYQAELEQKWMETLHKKYPVKINEKVLGKVRKRFQ